MEDNELLKRAKRLNLSPESVKKIMWYNEGIKEGIEQETKEIVQYATDELQKKHPQVSKEELMDFEIEIRQWRDYAGKSFRDVLIKGSDT